MQCTGSSTLADIVDIEDFENGMFAFCVTIRCLVYGYFDRKLEKDFLISTKSILF